MKIETGTIAIIMFSGLAVIVIIAFIYNAYRNYMNRQESIKLEAITDAKTKEQNQIDNDSFNIDNLPEPSRGAAIRDRANKILSGKG